MKIFISYRRDDSAGYAGRLRDYLEPYFGETNVFMDIETIEPGEDFRQAIHNAVSTCDVVLVMIGKQWLSIADAKGQRRLDDPDDLVRAEVASGLANEQIRVIPVLVRGASMPSSHELPNDLQGLPRRNAFELSDIRFRHDADVLIQRIKRFETPPPSPNPPEKNKSAYRKTAQGVLVLSLLIGIVGYSINAIRAAMTQSPASTMTLAATSTNKPVSTVTSTLTPYPTPSPHILMMDQYYKHINNAGNSDELKKAWDLLTAKLQCHLYEDCKFVHYKEWWWKWKVQYKLYDCGSLIIQTELRYYRRDSGTNATLTAPAYVKYWLVDDRGQLKIDSGLVTNKPDAECSQTASSQ